MKHVNGSQASAIPGAGAIGWYFTAVVCCFALQTVAFTAIAMVLSMVLLLCHVPALTGAKGLDRVILSVVVLTTTVSLPLAAVRHPTAVAHYFIVVGTVAVAFVVTRDLANYLRASRMVLLVAQAVIGLYLLSAGLDDYPLEKMLPGSSSNGITSYLVLLQVNYCMALFLAARRQAWVTPLLTLAICFVGFGRGSLLAAAAICVINSMHFLMSSHRMRIGLFIGVAVTVLAITLTGGWSALWLFVESRTKLGGGFYDPARATIIREYLQNMDLPGFFFGMGFDGTSIDTQFRGNPHNSFIRAHHIFGLPYLLVFLALPWLIFSPRRSWSATVYLFLMFSVLVFRSATETIVFPTLLDVFFFAICFACLRDTAMRRGLPPAHQTVTSDAAQ